MNLSKDLVPIIYKKDMDKEATKFLLKYCPEALDKPMPIPVEDIAELEMNLEIDYVNIDRNYDILGMMIFSDGVKENTKSYYLKLLLKKILSLYQLNVEIIKNLFKLILVQLLVHM
ncbi:hypothetical protein [Clostridium niameyense]|uniref:hypothetical protein n=1 Tax=Clostridium niameyense TaxID=1622073 RepID=UPI00067F55A3|nr:hypothetical protein [Clostridium niameyense]